LFSGDSGENCKRKKHCWIALCIPDIRNLPGDTDWAEERESLQGLELAWTKEQGRPLLQGIMTPLVTGSIGQECRDMNWLLSDSFLPKLLNHSLKHLKVEFWLEII
jgi:hypothetical protein